MWERRTYGHVSKKMPLGMRGEIIVEKHTNFSQVGKLLSLLLSVVRDVCLSYMDVVTKRPSVFFE